MYFCFGNSKITVGFRIRHLSGWAGHFVSKKCLCLQYDVGLIICRFREVLNWAGSSVHTPNSVHNECNKNEQTC